MDIKNAKRWQRQHAARLDIRAIKAERRVVERFGTDSPQVKELRAIPIARAHEVLTRAETLLTKPSPEPVDAVTLADAAKHAVHAMIRFGNTMNWPLNTPPEYTTAINTLRAALEREPDPAPGDAAAQADAAAVIERLEATIRTQRQRITTLEDQVAGVQSEAGTARSNLKALENIVDQGIKLFDDAGYEGMLIDMIAQALHKTNRPKMHTNSEASRRLNAIATKLAKAGFDGDNPEAAVDDLLAIAKIDDAGHWFRMASREKNRADHLHRTVVRRRLDEPEHGAEHAEGLAQGATEAVS